MIKEEIQDVIENIESSLEDIATDLEACEIEKSEFKRLLTFLKKVQGIVEKRTFEIQDTAQKVGKESDSGAATEESAGKSLGSSEISPSSPLKSTLVEEGKTQ